MELPQLEVSPFQSRSENLPIGVSIHVVFKCFQIFVGSKPKVLKSVFTFDLQTFEHMMPKHRVFSEVFRAILNCPFVEMLPKPKPVGFSSRASSNIFVCLRKMLLKFSNFQ